MAIITLTTDYGHGDFYLAALKAKLLSQNPDVKLVDITHEIEPFNVLQAAFLLKNVFREFPEGTIHLVGVDSEGGDSMKMIAVEIEKQYFLGPDNGLLSLVSDGSVNEGRLIDIEAKDHAFLAKDVLAMAAIRLSIGEKFEYIGPHHHIREALWGDPPLSGNSLRGTIMHLDHFGNAITNVRKEYFESLAGDKSFRIYLRKLELKRISKAYGDVSRGEALAIFGSSGFLEISIREGSAKYLLGLTEQDMLTIEFANK